jgi:hypothetical protein
VHEFGFHGNALGDRVHIVRVTLDELDSVTAQIIDDPRPDGFPVIINDVHELDVPTGCVGAL